MDIGNDVTDYDARTYVRPAEKREYLEQMLERIWDWCSRWSVTPAADKVASEQTCHDWCSRWSVTPAAGLKEAGYKNPLHQTQMRTKVIGKGRDSMEAEFAP